MKYVNVGIDWEWISKHWSCIPQKRTPLCSLGS